jgi:hypothetical protein
LHHAILGGDPMQKLTLIHLEKRVAPRYVPFGG